MIFNLAVVLSIYVISSVIKANNSQKQPRVYNSVNSSSFSFRFKEDFNESTFYRTVDLENQNLTRNLFDANNGYDVSILSKPDLLGKDKPQDLIEYITINLNKGPQSLTVLMNFESSGISTLQLLNDYMVYWKDTGYCKHGQVYDPLVGLCRDVFCTQGYIFTNKGCVPDLNANKTGYLPVKEKPDQLEIEITLSHIYNVHIINSNVVLKHGRIMEIENFADEFKKGLSNALNVNPNRIDKVKILSQDTFNETGVFSKPIVILVDGLELTLDSNYLAQFERTTFSFLLRDYHEYPDENVETIVLYYYLSKLAIENKLMKVMNHSVLLSDVTESLNANKTGWCNEPNKKLFVMGEFRIYAYFDPNSKPKYFVFVNQTETLYGVGYFYLTVAYISKVLGNSSNSEKSKLYPDLLEDSKEFPENNIHFSQYIYSQHNEKGKDFLTIVWNLKYNPIIMDDDFFDYKNTSVIYLKDVTDVVLDKGSNLTYTQNLLTVCNRAPKIRVDCENHETIRIRLCELDLMKNNSYCSNMLNVCFSINEYEYDELKPDDYIRICKYKPTLSSSNLIKNYDLSKEFLDKSNDLMNCIPGWVSVFSMILSIIFMLATLFTYALSKELRNIPGWNMINLTTALIIAETSFLAGSLSGSSSLLCFLSALMTHYGFLASFFWMNVIAFDLHRNFRLSSNILLLNLAVKERLPKYAIYAWISPFIIVLISLAIDLSIKDSTSVASYRPCYAGFLDGCIDYNNLTSNKSEKLFEGLNETQIDECYSEYKQIYLIAILSKTCWIQSGKANTIFFGVPIGVVILSNAVFYILTICNIRKQKIKLKENMRRFSGAKMASDYDVKFYIQIAFIMGFMWVIGYFLTTFSSDNPSYKVIYQILIYLFILFNASIGIFIYFLFMFKKDTLQLYKRLFKRWFPKAKEAKINKDQSQHEGNTKKKKEKTSISRLVSNENNNIHIKVTNVLFKNVLFNEKSNSESNVTPSTSKISLESFMGTNDSKMILRI